MAQDSFRQFPEHHAFAVSHRIVHETNVRAKTLVKFYLPHLLLTLERIPKSLEIHSMLSEIADGLSKFADSYVAIVVYYY